MRNRALDVEIISTDKMVINAGLDIGYVPAGPDAFFRSSGQFRPKTIHFILARGASGFFFLVLAPGVWLTVLQIRASLTEHARAHAQYG